MGLTSMPDTFQVLVLADKLMIDDALAQHIARVKMPALMKEGQELTAMNIRRAYSISGARAVATIFAKYSVKKYMATMEETQPKQKGPEFEFARELEEVHAYAIDLMRFVTHAIRIARSRSSSGYIMYQDPVTEKFERV